MRRGFSLIEVAIAMAVAGLMLAYIFRGGASVDCITPTKQQLATIGIAVDAYVKNSNHTHYPKPAGRAVGITSPQFGRAATNASDIDSANGVLSGALPFAELGLAPSYAADCWGNKFTYVVTEALTSSDSVTGFKNSAILGNISVKDSAGVATINQVAYAVISHGANGLGAVAQNYSDANTPPNKKWCTGATGSLDTHNCDIKNATIYNAEFNNGKGSPTFFDDLLNFSGKPVRKACAADDVIWGGTCTGQALAAKDGETQSVTDLNYNANVATVTCDDGELKSTGTCTPPPTCNATNPLNGSALTLSEGESSIYSGGATCTQLSCCSGTTVTTTPSPCPAAGVHAAGANCPAQPTCIADNTSYTGNASQCCSGDADNNGVCGAPKTCPITMPSSGFMAGYQESWYNEYNPPNTSNCIATSCNGQGDCYCCGLVNPTPNKCSATEYQLTIQAGNKTPDPSLKCNLVESGYEDNIFCCPNNPNAPTYLYTCTVTDCQPDTAQGNGNASCTTSNVYQSNFDDTDPGTYVIVGPTSGGQNYTPHSVQCTLN